MSSALEHTFAIVESSVLADDDFGYPASLAFVPSDRAGWRELLWQHVGEERIPTAVVDPNGSETLFTPLPRSFARAWGDRLLGRVSVMVQARHSLAGRGPGPAHEATIARSDLATLSPSAPHVDRRGGSSRIAARAARG